jgi:trans-L-3-hydroxyproline dehydratase
VTGKLTVVDMHTGGEPVRIITAGYPPIPQGTILQKRAFVRDNLDHLRRLLMFEPRGHADMYGALLVEPDLSEAALAVLFMHNEGYSTMCGHAVIALGRYAVDEGLVPTREPITTVNIECPCGLVRADVEVAEGRAGAVSFESVPAFLHTRDAEVDLSGYGRVSFDIAYGGAFYALADAAQFGLEFGRSRVRDFQEAAAALTEAAKAAIPLDRPDDPDLAFLYGSILTDGADGSGGIASKNVCVFADAQVDRSPTGSGVTARLAAMHARGAVKAGEERLFESIAGSRFTGAIAGETKAGACDAVTVRVSGRAYYTGTAAFRLEEGDGLGKGFLLR